MRSRKEMYLLITLIFAAMLFVGSSNSSAADYVWKCGINLPVEHPYYTGMAKFSELMEKKSNGKIKMQVFPSSQLGNERDMIEALQMGTQEVTLVSTAPLSCFSADFLVFDLPYIFKTREHAYKVLDGPIGQKILASLEKNKLVGLTFMENGFYNITCNKKIEHPADMQGVKIRSLENPLQVFAYNTTGANALPMSFGEVFTALQNKTLDATGLTYAVIGSMKIYTVQKYMADTWHFYAPAPLLISQKTWNALPDDLKAIVKEAAKEATVFQREQSAAVDQAKYEEMKKYGNIFTSVNREEWAKVMVAPTYAKFVGEGKEISADLVKQIQDMEK